MLFWKILLLSLSASIPFLVLVLDYVWHDKRTRKFKTTRKVLMALSPIVLFGGIAVLILDEHRQESAQAALLEQGKELKDQLKKTENAAQARAMDQETHIQNLGKQIDTLQARLTPFEELAKRRYPTATDQEALGKLRDDVAAVFGRTVELERRTAPRQLSEQLAQKVQELLKAYRGNRVVISASGGDPEARQFGIQLADIFNRSGWVVSGVHTIFSVPFIELNILTAQEQVPPRAKIIQKALHDAELNPTMVIDKTLQPDDVVVYVGSKRLK